MLFCSVSLYRDTSRWSLFKDQNKKIEKKEVTMAQNEMIMKLIIYRRDGKKLGNK
jgi:hypothetical protein